MKACDICENADKEKRSGVCVTCKYNCTYGSHLKVSKQASRIMEWKKITLEEVLNDEKE